MSKTVNLNNLFVVDGINFEDRFNLQGSGSIAQFITIGGNGYQFALGWNATETPLTDAQVKLFKDNLPSGSVIIDAPAHKLFTYDNGQASVYSGSVVA